MGLLKRLGTIDIGTNSFLLLVVDVDTQGVIHQVLHDESRIVRLGEGLVKTKIFQSEALQRAQLCLGDFVQTARKYNVDNLVGIATAAAREATNRDLLLQIAKNLNFEIHIIGGLKEAEMTFAGATLGISEAQKPCWVVDVGGGSTEMVLGQGESIYKKDSLPIGVVKLTEAFSNGGPVDSLGAQNFLKSLPDHLDLNSTDSKTKPSISVVAVGGTPTTLAHVCLGGGSYDSKKVHGFILKKSVLLEFQKYFEEHSPEVVAQKYNVDLRRADVLLAGTLILLEALRRLGQDQITVSTGGVRFGALRSVLNNELN